MSRKTPTQYRESKRQRLLEAGELPTCECGCGEYVKLDSNSKPRRFLRGHHDRWDDVIDRERIRAFLTGYKEERDVAWSEVARRAGISLSHLNSIMWDKRDRGISQDLARQIVSSLHNYRQVGINDEIIISGRRENQGLMAYDPDSYGSTKTCRKCGEIKGLHEFHLDATGKQGRRSACKQCRCK
ncbi:MAG: hypothetical protein ACWGQW_11080 [bacterium]